MIRPCCLEMLGTKHPVTQQHIPQTSKLHTQRLAVSKYSLEIRNSCLASFYFSKFVHSALNHTDEKQKNIPTIFLLVEKSEVLILGATDIMVISEGGGSVTTIPAKGRQSGQQNTNSSKKKKKKNILR